MFTGVLPNSPLPALQEAVGELKRLNADAVIALGGGSAIVTARAAAILLAEAGDVRSLCTAPDGTGKLISPKLLKPKLPQLVIPTTPTTAIVRVGSAILDPVAGERLALYDPATRAQVVLIHPELIKSAPSELVVSAGVNTLVMAIEGLMTKSGDPISDALLIHAVRLLAQELPAAVQGHDLAVRADLMMASILCGQGTDDTATAAAVVEAFQTLFDELGIPRRLRDIGVKQDGLRELAEMSLNDWFIKSNPRKVHDAAELEPILAEAW